MISWELAMDKYKLTRYFLEMMAILSNDEICNAKTEMVKDMWGKHEKV